MLKSIYACLEAGRHCNTRPAYGITDLCIPAGEGGFMRFWYPASQSDIVWVWRTHWLCSCGADSCVGYASAWGAHTRCHPEWQQRWVPIWIQVWVRVRSTLWKTGTSDSRKVVGEAALWNCRVDAGREIRWRWSGTSSCPLACLTPDEAVASLSICDPSEKHDEPFQARSRCHEEVSAASTGRWSAAAPGVETSDCLKRMR